MPHYLRMGRKEQDVNAPIKWTPHERESVAAEALKIHTADPSITPYKAVAHAQRAVLPVSRQRPIQNTQPVKVEAWLIPMWDEMRTANRKASANAAARQNAEALFTNDGVNIDGPQSTEATADTAITDDVPAQADAADAATASEVEQPEAVITPEIAPSPEVAASTFDAAQDDSKVSTSNVEADDGAQPEISKSHDTRRLVHWRDDEKKKVCARAYSNMKRWPDMSQLDAFRKAQDSELPESRRRDLNSWFLVKNWAEPMLEACALDERIEAARIAEEQEREREEQAARARAEEEAERRHQIEEQTRQAAFNRAVADRVANLSFDELLHALARRFGRAMFEGFNEGFRTIGTPQGDPPPANAAHPPSPPSAHSTTPPREVEPPRPRLPKVCVVGLLNQQEHDVEKAFLGVIDFEFVKSQRIGGNGHGGHALADKSRKCELIASMVDFQGHDVEKHARKLDVPLMRINGSASALKRELRKWLDERDAKAA
jgi:hypothetical protein